MGTDLNAFYTYNFFGEIPTDRLISGFLTVNAVHDVNDPPSPYTDDWKKILTAPDDTDYSRGIPTNQHPHNPHVKADGNHIGDYHCWLFWVVVGCHWHPARVPAWTPVGTTDRQIPDHPHCQSYVRAFPVALINPDTGTLMNHKAITVNGTDGVVVSKLGNPSNGEVNPADGSWAQKWYWDHIAAQFGAHNGPGSPYKQPTGTKIDPTLHNEFAVPSFNEYEDEFGNMTLGGNPYSGFPDMAWNRIYNELNPYGRGNNSGLMPNYGNGLRDSDVTVPPNDNDPDDGDGVSDMNTIDINDTLKSPIYSILIEGYHELDFGDIDNEDGTGSFPISRHTAFNLRVQLKIKTNDTDSHPDNNPGPGTPNDEWIGGRRVRCNVLYQPFGETSKIKFINTPPTGSLEE